MRTRAQGSRERAGGARGFFTPGRIAALVIIAVTLVFVFQNTGEVEIRLLIPEVTMPLWLALFGTLLIGGLTGAVLAMRRRPGR
ncbi:lipopolysaccharide assembly protein LapA domain-containing protein [Streptomyces aidingensis]|uniref:Lipopolysaccharide assembly protein A domain-containing protein n=1 Tax=Streptomyces aidingensis TaxID=910347 RepID=A0A1I1J159_9ACTN|nr:LapA family protein [Streptomyces aidingensis]SFC42206.1 Protein of unknown function [Streptomyces aidingensis]